MINTGGGSFLEFITVFQKSVLRPILFNIFNHLKEDANMLMKPAEDDTLGITKSIS